MEEVQASSMFGLGNTMSESEQFETQVTTLEATQGHIDGFFSQLPYKCHQNRVASLGD